MDRGEAALRVPAGAVAEEAVLSLCRTEPDAGRYEPLSSGWQIELEAGTLRGPFDLALRVADPRGAALLVSEQGEPSRAILAEEKAGGELSARLYRPAVVTAARDERVLSPFAPRPAAADVLLVVDNSCSNLDDQLVLRGEVSVLLDRLQANRVDFHVGVISTDHDDPGQQGRLAQAGGQRWVEPGTLELEAVLDDLLDQGNQGATREQGLATTLDALTVHAETANAGFFREGAALSIVVMSDHDDQGDTDPQALVEALRKEQERRPVVEFHGLLDSEANGRYLAVTQQIGGTLGDIDGGGWARFMGRVGDRLAVEAAMALPREEWPELWLVPDDGSEPRPAPDPTWGWLPEEHLLWLTQPGPENAQLVVLAAP